MRLVLHVLALLLFVISGQAQISSNQRILFGAINSSIGPGGSSNPIRSYCFDESRDWSSSYCGFRSVHYDGASKVQIGNAAPISLQQALNEKKIEFVGDSYESFQIKNNTNQAIKVVTEGASIIGDVKTDKEGLAESIFHVDDSYSQDFVWLVRTLQKMNFPSNDYIKTALQIESNRFIFSDWIKINDEKLQFLNINRVDGEVIEYNVTNNSFTKVFSYHFPYFEEGVFVEKVSNDLFIVNTRLVHVGDRHAAIQEVYDKSGLVVGENMSAKDVQGILRTYQIKTVVSDGNGFLGLSKVTSRSHNFEGEPAITVTDNWNSGKDISFDVTKKNDLMPFGNERVFPFTGPVNITISEVEPPKVQGIKTMIRQLWARLRGDSNKDLSTELMKDLSARRIPIRKVKTTMFNIDISLNLKKLNYEQLYYCGHIGSDKNNQTAILPTGLEPALEQGRLQCDDQPGSEKGLYSASANRVWIYSRVLLEGCLRRPRRGLSGFVKESGNHGSYC